MTFYQNYFSDLDSYQTAGPADFIVYIFAIRLMANFNVASAFIQGSWIIIGLIGLALRLRGSSPLTATPFKTPTHSGATS